MNNLCVTMHQIAMAVKLYSDINQLSTNFMHSRQGNRWNPDSYRDHNASLAPRR